MRAKVKNKSAYKSKKQIRECMTMKKNMRVIAAAAMAAVMIAMTGCGSSGGAEETTAETTGDGTYTVGIIQQLEHVVFRIPSQKNWGTK